MKKLIKWWALLTKRLYKKPTFVVLLLLIPALALGYGVAAAEDSGMITIALAKEDNADTMASAVVTELMESSRLIRFVRCESPEEAEKQVCSGQADAAWIFEADMEEKVYDFLASRSKRDAFVRVLERESTTALMLTHEKLGGAVYACCSEALYLSYIRENVPEMDGVSDEELLSYFHDVSLDHDLFEFSYLDPAQSTEDAASASYLMTPVRGMLGVVIVLCGLAAGMYYIQDSHAGTFAWVAEGKRPLVELGCQMISVLNVSVVVWISLAVVGQTVGFWRELLVMLLHALCVAVFSMTLRRLIGSLRGLGTVLPLLAVVMLVVCPVFFDLGALRELQYLFPPTYFINAVYSDKFLLYMPLYTLVLAAVYFLTGVILNRK